jgi:hypothetical protein
MNQFSMALEKSGRGLLAAVWQWLKLCGIKSTNLSMLLG